MILEISPDAPAIVHVAAGTALVLHIAGGLTGIAAGAVAMAGKKGGRLHRLAGTVFFVSMLTMAGVAAIVAPMLPEAQVVNTMAGVFTLYLVASSWITVRRPAGAVGRFERAAVIVPLGLAAFCLAVIPLGLATGRGGAVGSMLFAGFYGLVAAWDLRMIRAGGVAGRDRIARHLWRMTAAWFVATGSFFLGQPDHVPQLLKDTGLNVIFAVAPLPLLVFWMIRTKAPRLFRLPLRRPAAA